MCLSHSEISLLVPEWESHGLMEAHSDSASMEGSVRFSLPGTLSGGGGRGLDITVDPPLSTHHLPFVTAREEAFSNQQAAFPV